MPDRMIRLSLEVPHGGNRVSQALYTSGDIFDSNVIHVLHFQLDAIIRGLRTTIEDMPK